MLKTKMLMKKYEDEENDNNDDDDDNKWPARWYERMVGEERGDPEGNLSGNNAAALPFANKRWYYHWYSVPISISM